MDKRVATNRFSDARGLNKQFPYHGQIGCSTVECSSDITFRIYIFGFRRGKRRGFPQRRLRVEYTNFWLMICLHFKYQRFNFISSSTLRTV
jgi:hypothetical protein